MKVNWNSKYNTVAVYSLIVICISILFYFFASQIGSFSAKISYLISIMYPFIIGFVLAYLLNFILRFYEERVLVNIKSFNKIKQSRKRIISILLTYLTFGVMIYLSIHFVFPQLTESIVGIINQIPQYMENVRDLTQELINNFEINDHLAKFVNEKISEISAKLIAFISEIAPLIANIIMNLVSSIWNIVLGLIISVYLLLDKEKFYALSKKMVTAMFSRKTADRIFELTYRSNNTFGKFVSGKIIDSAIIGVLSFVLFSIAKMPYAVLISVIVGITNIIPFFGPFIGAVPCFLLILFESPTKSIIFLVLIFIIQQIDGNIIGPKILGDSIGISAFWILFSILVAGELFGFIGMIIGVPLFAIIYSIIKENVEYKLKEKNLPTDTKDYM